MSAKKWCPTVQGVLSDGGPPCMEVIITLFSDRLHAFYIRTSKSGPEAQLFLSTKLIATLLRDVGQFLFCYKQSQKTHLRLAENSF